MIPSNDIIKWSETAPWMSNEQVEQDLFQKNPGPIKITIDSLRKVLNFVGDPKIKQKSNNNILIFRFNSESTRH